jgi:hypothetical protein
MLACKILVTIDKGDAPLNVSEVLFKIFDPGTDAWIVNDPVIELSGVAPVPEDPFPVALKN